MAIKIYLKVLGRNMEEKKENKIVFNDENYEEQFKKAIERGRKALKKNKTVVPPIFLLKKGTQQKCKH